MASPSLVADRDVFFKPISKFKGVVLCDEHRHIKGRTKANFEKRKQDVLRKYVLERSDSESTRFVTVGSSGKGSRSYSYKLYRRVNSHVRPAGSIAILLTLTWGRDVGCIACAYGSILKRWRSLRQNWGNHNFPSILGYIGCVEPHKSYYPHLHFLLYVDRYFSPGELSKLHKVWGARVDVQVARKPVNYIVKYINKSLGSLYFISFLSVLNVRQFYFSRGILPTWKSIKDDSASYWFLGETEYDIRLFSDFVLEYHIANEHLQLGSYTLISEIAGVKLWAK